MSKASMMRMIKLNLTNLVSNLRSHQVRTLSPDVVEIFLTYSDF